MFSSRHIETSSSPEHKFVKNLHHKNKIKELLDLSKGKKTKLFRIKSYCKWTLANHPDEKKSSKQISTSSSRDYQGLKINHKRRIPMFIWSCIYILRDLHISMYNHLIPQICNLVDEKIFVNKEELLTFLFSYT